MNMKWSLACVAALVSSGVFAEEEEEEAAASEDVAEAAVAVTEQRKDETKWFFTLPLCRRVHGSGEVLRPGDTAWQPIEEGRFYPLGSSYRASRGDSMVMIAFGKDCTVTVENGASFSTRAQKLGEPSRTVVLTGGEVAVSLPTNLKPDLFFVTTSAFKVCNMAGDSKYVFTDKGDGFEADIRCVTGVLGVEGRHYSVAKMQAADVMRVRSSHDDLETILYGKSGDYVVQLDTGLILVSEVQDDGTVKESVEPTKVDFHLSVGTHVQINRGVPAVGNRLSVVTMAFDSTGKLQSLRSHSEGRPEVNSGELIFKPKETSEVAKRAAEVTTESAVAESEEEPADEEESAEEGGSASSDEEEEE